MVSLQTEIFASVFLRSPSVLNLWADGSGSAATQAYVCYNRSRNASWAMWGGSNTPWGEGNNYRGFSPTNDGNNEYYFRSPSKESGKETNCFVAARISPEVVSMWAGDAWNTTEGHRKKVSPTNVLRYFCRSLCSINGEGMIEDTKICSYCSVQRDGTPWAKWAGDPTYIVNNDFSPNRKHSKK